jgi:hypothetical protein
MKQSRLLLGSCLLPLLLELSKPARVIIKQKKKKVSSLFFFCIVEAKVIRGVHQQSLICHLFICTKSDT